MGCHGCLPVRINKPAATSVPVVQRPIKKRVVGLLDELQAKQQYPNMRVNRQSLGAGVVLLTFYP